MRALFVPLALIWAGCAAEVDINTDPDGDGLTDAGEAQAGSDPANPDSDQDGYLDGAESTGNTDPMNPDDHPYAGGWPIGSCRSQIEPTGNTEGEVASNFSMLDQYGESVELYAFCDKVVYITFAAVW